MTSPQHQILDAAEARLLEGGPAALELEAIAAGAGVDEQVLRQHFPTAEDLVAGLCERMLTGFDEKLRSLSDAEHGPGAWTRAYLASTVTHDGEPADDSAQLMAGILATLGRDSGHLHVVRECFAQWHRRLASDGIDPTLAIVVRLAADGLWLSSLLGLAQIEPERRADVVRALRALTQGPVPDEA